MPLPLLAFSPIPWTSAFRRPQHLLWRLARNRPIYYVEAPVWQPEEEAGIRTIPVSPNLQVLRPHSAWKKTGFNFHQIMAMAEVLTELLADAGVESCDVWTNTPMIQPLMDCLNPKTLIYDVNYGVQAELDNPQQWHALEQELVSQADMVIASNTLALQPWEGVGNRLRTLEGGVDISHFFFAEEPEKPRRRRIGFAGTLDHRIDFALMDLVASEFPDCELTVVGPMTPGGQVTIPRRDNVSYHGVLSYRLLPGFLKSFDVGLLPYLDGGSNERNNVAKIAEYFAAGLPVVSTTSNLVPLKSGAACVARSHSHFLESCDRMLQQGIAERQRRILAGYEAIEYSSWDRAADSLQDALDGKCSASAMRRN